jgi:antitoxin component YwqK of YwqJK toxin-antitoxin module
MMSIDKVFLLFVHFLSISAFAQENKIIVFRDDTILQQKLMGRFENKLNQHYYGSPIYDFKEKLPDGQYIYVSINRQDSTKVNFENFILIKGHFKDSLRNGKFEYYGYCGTGRKINKNRNLSEIFNYHNGLLNGYYMAANCENILFEGNYKLGNRDGFFYTYDAYGILMKIEVFRNDTLQYFSTYPNITIIKPAEDTIKDYRPVLD